MPTDGGRIIWKVVDGISAMGDFWLSRRGDGVWTRLQLYDVRDIYFFFPKASLYRRWFGDVLLISNTTMHNYAPFNTKPLQPLAIKLPPLHHAINLQKRFNHAIKPCKTVSNPAITPSMQLSIKLFK